MTEEFMKALWNYIMSCEGEKPEEYGNEYHDKLKAAFDAAVDARIQALAGKAIRDSKYEQSLRDDE